MASRIGNPAASATHPTLTALFAGFLNIGALSFGGGLMGWIRREVVEQRGWLDDQQFLSGLALCQIAPGATNVNLAVFIGTQLRGAPGALAAIAGLMAVPLAVVLAAGTAYFATRGTPGGNWIGSVLGGMGAVAIGLNLATGIRLARRNLRSLRGGLVTLATTIAVGVLRLPLLEVLGVMVVVSAVLTWPDRQR
jgi:chromate transporter